MAISLLRTDKEIKEIYQRHVDTVYRVAWSFMRNQADAEDIVQETFVRLISSGKAFQSVEHEKAWLIVTASNLCKNTLKTWWRKNEDIDDYTELPGAQDEKTNDVLEAVMSLPEEQRIAVYLYYYEGYSTPEIARMFAESESTVRNRLFRARRQLKIELGGDFDEQEHISGI